MGGAGLGLPSPEHAEFNTPLEEDLRKRGTEHVIVSGFMTRSQSPLPRALTCFTLSLFAFARQRGSIALPSRAEPLPSFSRGCLALNCLLEHTRLPYARRRRLGGFDHLRQVRIDDFYVLLQRRVGFLEVLAVGALRPLTGDDAKVLVVCFVQLHQRTGFTARLLSRLRQALAPAAILQRCLDSGDPLLSDPCRTCFLVGRNSTLLCGDVGDPLFITPDRSLMILANLVPLISASRLFLLR